jgi:hypothetical protein
MARTLVLVVLLAATCASFPAHACQRMAPSTVAPEGYSAVFIARVTGVHLVGYENGVLSTPDLVDPALGPLSIRNGASPVTIRVAITQSIRGLMSGALELRLAGCTLSPPALREKAIFFVQPGGNAAIWVSPEDPAYAAWLARLGVPELAR